MPLLFGACGGIVAPGGEPFGDVLRRFPTVRSLERHRDDDCFLALGSPEARPASVAARGLTGSGGGRHVLALDGWLANRTELIRTLGLTGSSDTLPDTSVIAAALQLWGGDALPRLHGDFAIVWWDRVERRLLLACDRTGGRTLFYHAAGTRLFFANVTGALFVHPDVPRTLNPTMVARSAFSATVDFEDTCFAGIRQLLPGQRLDWSPAGPPRVSAYWRLDLTRRCRFRRDEDYVEAGRELLDTVVGEAARTDGVLASLLSGGLDSTAVAATAARLTTPTPLHTITVRPDPSCALPACGPRAFQDEWSHAQAVARLHPSMVAHAVFASPETLEDDLRTGRLIGQHPASSRHRRYPSCFIIGPWSRRMRSAWVALNVSRQPPATPRRKKVRPSA